MLPHIPELDQAIMRRLETCASDMKSYQLIPVLFYLVNKQLYQLTPHLATALIYRLVDVNLPQESYLYPHVLPIYDIFAGSNAGDPGAGDDG